jgi:fucose permease
MSNKLTYLDIASWGGFMSFASSGIVIPLCLPEISKTLNISLSQGGAMETARTFIILAVLLISGIIANRWGKKPLMAIGQYLIAIGAIMASYSQDYYILIISLMIMGIGGGATEAIINPLVLDIHPNESNKYLSLTNAFYPIGVIISALLFGELLTLGYSWRSLFLFIAIIALAMGFIFNISKFPEQRNQKIFSWNLIRNVLFLKIFWIYSFAIFLAAGVESAFTFWSRSYVEIYLHDLPRAGAIAVVVFSCGMALGRFLAARLSNKVSPKILMIWSSFFGLLITIYVTFITNLILFAVLLFFAGIATACFWPNILAVAAEDLDTDATILMVLLAVFGVAGFGFIPWVMGMIGDNMDLKSSFLLIPVCFLGLIFLSKKILRKV